MKTNSLLYTSALLLSGVAPLLVGCRNTAGAQMAPIVDGSAAATDPAAANLATPYAAADTARPSPVRYAAVAQNGNGYPQASQSTQPQSGNSQQNEAYRYNTQAPQNANGQQQYADPQYANGQQGNGQYSDPAYAQNGQITDDEYDQYEDLLDPNVPQANQAPPPLPVDYEQPEAPGPDYLWTPGYWDYANTGYYYVPGAWVGAPYAGALWTPGWWGYAGSGYRWHHGYWGQHVGYYGGVNYGFGFIGFGYQGGYWNNNHFFYNRAVNRLGSRVGNNFTYDRRISVSNNSYINNSRTSYFGGPGGLRRGPAPQEFAARREGRTPPMQAQIANRQAAQGNRQQFFNSNGGRPQMLVSNRALQADRNVTAPARVEPGNGFTGRPGFNKNGTNGNVQERQGFNQQRQQQDLQRGQERNQLLQQQNTNAQQRDQNLQQRNTNLQQRNTDLQQRQGLDQVRQQQQLNSDQQRQQFQQLRQQQQLNEGQQRQGFDPQRQQQLQQGRQQLNDTQRQQSDALRQQFQQQRAVQDQQRTQQVQQQRQQQDQRMMNAERQQQNVQRQQQDVQRQQQMMQSRPTQAPHIEAPRAVPSMPRMEAPHAEAPHPGGGGDHHR